MVRRLFVPLDGSPFAEYALPAALAIARRAGAGIELAHVHVPPFSSSHVRGVRLYASEADTGARATAVAYTAGMAERVTADHDVVANASVRTGPVFETLIEMVAASGADLIVMTTHGHGSPNRTWLGSITDRMLRESPVPLILMRSGSEPPRVLPEMNLTRILVACDGTPLSEQVFSISVELAQLFGAELTLLQVVPAQAGGPGLQAASAESGHGGEANPGLAAVHDYLSGTAQHLGAAGLRVAYSVVAHPHAATAILETARQGRFDLVALTTHGHGGVRKVLLGSVADKLVRGAEIPLLVYRPPAH